MSARANRPTAQRPAPIDLASRLALTVAETAALIGVSPATVRGMVRAGTLPGRRVGGGTEAVTYVIPVHALQAWLRGERQTAADGEIAP